MSSSQNLVHRALYKLPDRRGGGKKEKRGGKGIKKKTTSWKEVIWWIPVNPFHSLPLPVIEKGKKEKEPGEERGKRRRGEKRGKDCRHPKHY